jgi:hypothetical protein
MIRGNALVLARGKQLAVFNLQSGLDVYNLPDFTWTHAARYDTNTRASQGLAQFKSGTHLISPTGDGRILVLDAHNATVIATLQNPCANFLFSFFSTLTFYPTASNSSFGAVDVSWLGILLGLLSSLPSALLQAGSIPNRKVDYIVGAIGKGSIVVWRNYVRIAP